MTIHLIYSVGRPMARGGRGRRWSFRCHQMPSTSKSIWEIIGEYLGEMFGKLFGKTSNAINFSICLGKYWGKYQMPSTSQSIWEIIGEYLRTYLGKYQMPSTSQSIWENIWENIKCHQLPNLFGKILGNIWENIWENIKCHQLPNLFGKILGNIWENIKCHQLTNLTGKLLGNIWENIKLHQLSNLFSQFNIGECLRTYLGIFGNWGIFGKISNVINFPIYLGTQGVFFTLCLPGRPRVKNNLYIYHWFLTLMHVMSNRLGSWWHLIFSQYTHPSC